MALPNEKRSTLPLMVLLGLPVFAASATSTSHGSLPACLPSDNPTLLAFIFAMVVSSAWFLFTAKTTDGLADRWARFILSLLWVRS